MDCVIFFDNFSQDIINLFNRLDIDLEEKEIPKMNFTQKEPISDELLDKIKQLNLLDTQLYAYAKACLQKKDTLYPLRTKTFDKILKKSSDIDYSFNLPLKGRGWSYREVTEGDFGNNSVYRWVTDQPAHIYFSLEEGIDYDFSFTAQTLTSEISPKTSVNGREIELSQEANDLFSIYRGKIPKSYLTHEPVEIVFYSSKAFLYKDAHPSHQNRNYPLLSFAINNIKIVKE